MNSNLERAAQLLNAASVLIKSGPAHMVATLLLTGQAAELLLKIRPDQAGVNVRALTLRHNLLALWHLPENAELRVQVLSNSHVALGWAKDDHYEDDLSDTEPEVLFMKHFQVLSDLHGKETDFGLRYSLPDDTKGPIPIHLVETLRATISQIARATP